MIECMLLRLLCKVHTCFNYTASGALLGDPNGSDRHKVFLTNNIKQGQILNAERKSTSQEQLAISLLLLLFSIITGNCTKPVREDILQLDTERPLGNKM